MRPLSFRRVDDESAAENARARPNWLAPRDMQIRPAFVEEPRAPIRLPAPVEHVEPEPERSADLLPPKPTSQSQLNAPVYAQVAGYGAEPPVARLSSLPPRKSVYPPQRTLSRHPPAPVEQQPSAEQEAFVHAALDLAALRGRVLSQVENELLSLAVHIAQAIIEREVKLDPSLHITLARTAVLALGDTQAARLRVSRAAYRAITELHGEAAIDVEGVRVELSMDASFDALSVVAEAGPSRVDSRVSERLAAVLRAMEAEHRRNNAEIAGESDPQP